jgi:hypothetical protein
MGSKTTLTLAAALEAATGLALITVPSVVARQLLGDELSGPGTAVGRVAGFGLLALGVSCWPSSGPPFSSAALRGLLCYNLLAAIYLMSLGIGGEQVGSLLWSVVVLHAVLTILLARLWFNEWQAKWTRPQR